MSLMEKKLRCLIQKLPRPYVGCNLKYNGKTVEKLYLAMI